MFNVYLRAKVLLMDKKGAILWTGSNAICINSAPKITGTALLC